MCNTSPESSSQKQKKVSVLASMLSDQHRSTCPLYIVTRESRREAAATLGRLCRLTTSATGVSLAGGAEVSLSVAAYRHPRPLVVMRRQPQSPRTTINRVLSAHLKRNSPSVSGRIAEDMFTAVPRCHNQPSFAYHCQP